MTVIDSVSPPIESDEEDGVLDELNEAGLTAVGDDSADGDDGAGVHGCTMISGKVKLSLFCLLFPSLKADDEASEDAKELAEVDGNMALSASLTVVVDKTVLSDSVEL